MLAAAAEAAAMFDVCFQPFKRGEKHLLARRKEKSFLKNTEVASFLRVFLKTACGPRRRAGFRETRTAQELER